MDNRTGGCLTFAKWFGEIHPGHLWTTEINWYRVAPDQRVSTNPKLGPGCPEVPLIYHPLIRILVIRLYQSVFSWQAYILGPSILCSLEMGNGGYRVISCETVTEIDTHALQYASWAWACLQPWPETWPMAAWLYCHAWTEKSTFIYISHFIIICIMVQGCTHILLQSWSIF